MCVFVCVYVNSERNSVLPMHEKIALHLLKSEEAQLFYRATFINLYQSKFVRSTNVLILLTVICCKMYCNIYYIFNRN